MVVSSFSAPKVFRYPGSKTKLLPAIRKRLDPILEGRKRFHDVFVGGGSVLCSVAMTHPNIQLVANDLDHNMACFWRLVASPFGFGHAKFFELLQQKPTIDLFNSMRENGPTNEIEAAYHAVFFNRTTFSGISMGGPIGGKEQKYRGEGKTYTVDCRYNLQALSRGIREMMDLLGGRLTVTSLDAVKYMALTVKDEAYYLDPPYYKQGVNLYAVSMKHEQHQGLSDVLSAYPRDWVLSYDLCPEIEKMYAWANVERVAARYSIDGVKKIGSGWKQKEELLISPAPALVGK